MKKMWNPIQINLPELPAVNLPQLQAVIAPLTAPMPSALAIAAEAAVYTTAKTQPFFGWVAEWLGGFAFIAAFFGMESIGGAASYAVIKLHRERNYGIEFWVALAGVCMYVGTGLWSLWGEQVVIFFLLAPFAYFSYSILRSMKAEIEEKVLEKNAQVDLTNAQTRLVNAQTRQAKAEQGVQSGVHPVQVDTEHVQRTSRTVRPDVQSLLQTNPTLSARQIAKELHISPTTASEHKKLWETAKVQ